MRKKGIFIVLILASFTAIICFLGYEIVDKQSKNEHIKNIKEHLPNFEFYQLDSTRFSASILNKKTPLVLIHFNTECEHCQAEAQLIHQNFKAFSNNQIVMVAPNSPKEIIAFSKKYGINQHPQIKVLWDKDNHFVDWFGHSPFPSVYIYNRKQHLVKEYQGQVKIEAITKFLQ